jgi:hypothetical protein
MLVLDCQVSKEDWSNEIRERNGVAVPRAWHTNDQQTDGSGKWEPVVREIISYQHLSDDWDGLGAKAPSLEVLASAVALAHLFHERGVNPPHCVVPSPDGSINFEWQGPEGAVAEVEIDGPLHAEVMVMEPGKPARFWTIPAE